MITQQEILAYLKSNKKYFSEQFNVLKIGIFGSYARNEQTEDSDIDIIIDIQPGTEDIFEKRMLLKEIISHHFSKPVDICHLRSIKPLFRSVIFKELIYV